MARGRRRAERDASEIARDPLSDPLFRPPTYLPKAISVSPVDYFGEVQDLRRFDPTISFPSAWTGSDAAVGERRVGRSTFRYPMFSNPREAVLCARRQQRREVFFAKRLKRRKGRGGGRRNRFSNIHC